MFLKITDEISKLEVYIRINDISIIEVHEQRSQVVVYTTSDRKYSFSYKGLNTNETNVEAYKQLLQLISYAS